MPKPRNKRTHGTTDRKETIGYLAPSTGDKSTWGYRAAMTFANSESGVSDPDEKFDFRGYKSHNAVCEAVRRGHVDYGVVAIENIIDGLVIESLREVAIHAAFLVAICREVVVKVDHQLAAALPRLTTKKVAGKDFSTHDLATWIRANPRWLHVRYLRKWRESSIIVRRNGGSKEFALHRDGPPEFEVRPDPELDRTFTIHRTIPIGGFLFAIADRDHEVLEELRAISDSQISDMLRRPISKNLQKEFSTAWFSLEETDLIYATEVGRLRWRITDQAGKPLFLVEQEEMSKGDREDRVLNVYDGASPDSLVSHRSALNQCGRLKSDLEGDSKDLKDANGDSKRLDVRDIESTGQAAEIARKDAKGKTYAIISEEARRNNGLALVKRPGVRIATGKDNKTRFWVLTRSKAGAKDDRPVSHPAKHDIASLKKAIADGFDKWFVATEHLNAFHFHETLNGLFEEFRAGSQANHSGDFAEFPEFKTCFFLNLDHEEIGSLQKALQFFADEKVNLWFLHPISIVGQKWSYKFFMEFAGHIDDGPMRRAYANLDRSGVCSSQQVLGSYPSAKRQKEWVPGMEPQRARRTTRPRAKKGHA